MTRGAGSGQPLGPGGLPRIRAVHASTPTGRPRTARPYAGPGSVVEANARFRQLVADGATDLSVAFDLPSRAGHDSDAPIAAGEVGRTGIAVDSIDDMRVLLGGLPLAEVSTSLRLGAPGAAPFLLLCQLVGEEQGVAADRLTGAIRSDVLEECVTRGTHLFPPGPSRRLLADTFRYCAAEVPRWDAVSVSGRALADAGASPAQELAFTLATGIEYVRAAVAAGIDVTDFAPRLSFLFAEPAALAEERAKYRAAHRIWARVMHEEFGARDPGALLPRLGIGTAGAPADELETAALDLLGEVERHGGAAGAAARGFQEREIGRHAHRTGRVDEGGPYEAARIDPAIEARQAERLCKLRALRDSSRTGDALVRLQEAAGGTANVLHPMKEALAAYATVGEVCAALREVWGTSAPAV
ncbi:methylmalonyl-CoA mutase family protein [Kitasatospora sp. CM 4170]|nr:methylmalonyl-CoA mutase family protein [Kitasatospora sp. CM 4170]WNM48322.1 methylmalonyl-CoA mutase family protein [Kitasatospora sp. CM 4170]